MVVLHSIVLLLLPLEHATTSGILLSHGSTLKIWLQNLFYIAQKFVKAMQGRGKSRTAVPSLSSLELHPPKSPRDFQTINPEDSASRWRVPKRRSVLGKECVKLLCWVLSIKLGHTQWHLHERETQCGEPLN